MDAGSRRNDLGTRWLAAMIGLYVWDKIEFHTNWEALLVNAFLLLVVGTCFKGAIHGFE